MSPRADLLGPGQVHWLASIVEDGTATPEEARELLAEFVRQVDSGALSQRMLQHMRDCVAAFLVGKKVLMPAASENRHTPIGIPISDLSKAFGVTRIAPGKPRIDRETLVDVARDVLVRRLAGDSLEDAAGTVAEDRKARRLPVSSETQVRAAWTGHASDALALLRVARLPDVDPSAPPWSPTELDRLNEIFWGQPWFCPPGADARARQAAILAEVDRPGDGADVAIRVAKVIRRFDEPFKPRYSKNKKA